ncbi:MAG: hypothetical protein HAW61_01010 [Candidatus Portiera sp.]|nr:hypothetical protein [Portiera sp.]
MTTHVFIVDHSTFKVHLEYLFAGTGSGKYESIDFNNNLESELKYGAEANLASIYY